MFVILSCLASAHADPIGFLWDTEAGRLAMGGARVPAPLLDEPDPMAPASLTLGHSPLLTTSFVHEAPVRVFRGSQREYSLESQIRSAVVRWQFGGERGPRDLYGGVRIDAEGIAGNVRSGSEDWSASLNSERRVLAIARRRGAGSVGLSYLEADAGGQARPSPTTGERIDVVGDARMLQMEAFRDAGESRVGARVGWLETDGLVTYTRDLHSYGVPLDAAGWTGEAYG